MASKADSYFDLNRKQEENFRKDIDKDFQTARQKVFPEIASSLRTLNRELNSEKVNSAKLIKITKDIEGSFKKTTAHFDSAALKLSASLSEEQFQHFRKMTLKDIENSAEDSNSPQRSLEKSVKVYSKGLSAWLGSVSQDQKNEIKIFLKAHPYPWALQNESRRKLLDQFMDKRQNPAELEKLIRAFLQDYEPFRTTAFQAAFETHELAAKKFLFEELWPRLSAAQKDQVRTNLIAKAELLEDLARK